MSENLEQSEYLCQLNPVQREAVINYQGASLIIAGAGSGKTRVLTCRIAYMISQGIPSQHILALTFTNKAAKEMRERIGHLISPTLCRNLWMGTFHSIFARILRAESELLGYPSSFTIYDSSDSKNMVKLAVKELNLDEEVYKPGNVAARISRAKNNLVTVDAYAANSSLQAEDREQRMPEFLEIYRLYTHRCRENGAMDFDDLLLNINILFRDFPEALAKYQHQFRYILVDEYQDTNYAQYVIIRRLAEQHGNVCVVGDDAQSIYSFRGAKIENILRFQNDFPQAKVFKLEQNYRSTQNIVNAANCVIEKNQRQIPKKSFSDGHEGDKIKVVKAYTDREEASLIAADIYANVRNEDVPYSEIAILYRTNAQSRALEEALRTRNIPYKIYGGFSFYQRKEIKDLLAYVRLVINPRDNEAFRRVINTPTRGIGDVTVGRIAAAAESKGISLWEAVSTLTPEEIELGGAAGKKVVAFAQMITGLSEARHSMEAYTLGLEIATRSGLIGTYKMQQTPEAISALENIEELINSIRVFSEEQQQQADDMGEPLPTAITIEEWMQNVALLTDMDNENPDERNKITLMTVHAAKGLEFRYVYVAGLEENLFPSMMSIGTPEGLEEERRLFYVALTRAKHAAVLSFAESRFKWGEMSFSRPSRFLSEIDPKYLDVTFAIDDLNDDTERPDRGMMNNLRERKRHNDEKIATRMGGGQYYRSGGAGSGTYGGREAGRHGRAGDSGPAGSAGSGGRYGGSGNGNAYRKDSEATRPIKPAGHMRSMGERRATSGMPDRPLNTTGNHDQYVPGETANTAARTAPGNVSQAGGYAVGMRVEHAKFGVGTIVNIEEWSNDLKLTVDFVGAGKKTLLQKFAKLHIL